MVCMHCGLQRPNSYKSTTCPKCDSYLKYVESAAKDTMFKFYRAGLHTSYATSEVYSFANGAIHTASIYIGLSHPYPAIVFSRLPTGFEYVFPESYTSEYLKHIPIEHLISPVRTYGILRYEVDYLDLNEAKSVLKQKLKELDAWIDDAVTDWLIICNLGGFLD